MPPTFESRALPGALVRLHTSRPACLEHIERHFASTVALRAARFATPGLSRFLAVRSDRNLVRAVRCDATDPSTSDAIDPYLECARHALDEAARLGWVVAPRPGTIIALSSAGMLAVVSNGVLRTLFFPGLETHAAHSAELRDSGRLRAADLRRIASRTADEEHYYEVFRPAIQLVRSMPDDAVVGACSQYGALKRVLPAASDLRLDGWRALRDRIALPRLGADA